MDRVGRLHRLGAPFVLFAARGMFTPARPAESAGDVTVGAIAGPDEPGSPGSTIQEVTA